MNRRICRQVLDCGEGVREVTALAVAALKIPKLAADPATPTKAATAKTSSPQSKTLAPIRFALGSRAQTFPREREALHDRNR